MRIYTRLRGCTWSGSLILFFISWIYLAPIPSFSQFIKRLDFGSTGKNPYGDLYSDGTFLYGMTNTGGTDDLGAIFKIKANGTGYVKLFDFKGATNGSYPYGSLISDGTFLYGMTDSGGEFGQGTIFKIKPDGTSFITLFEFKGTNGSYPDGNLVTDGVFLYGMTSAGGTDGIGTIFKIMPDGSGFTTIFEFTTSADGGPPYGSYPYGSLIYDGTFLYGMASGGGNYDLGTIFKIMPDGTSFSRLFDFNGTSNGSGPYGSLISSGPFLYGLTSGGGAQNSGTLFRIMPDGTGFNTLFEFNEGTGIYPYGSLISDGTFLYGTTNSGGSNDLGTMFKILPDGTGFVNLGDFDGPNNGSYPNGSFIYDGGLLLAMTSEGGTSDLGTIFKISPDGTGYDKLLDLGTTGNYPVGSLISDGTFLYGMTPLGGKANLGTIFKVMPDGSGYSTLHDLMGWEFADGAEPQGSLFFDGTFLYGMTKTGGYYNDGMIFRIKPDGTNYSNIMDLSGQPYGSLISDGTFLYGMTSNGGNDSGTIFKIMPDGTGFNTISDFNTPAGGYEPHGDLMYDGTYLYGMTRYGGANGLGTIFRLLPDGSGFTNILDFTGAANGSNPFGSLISDGTSLYGMTNTGGTNDLGAIFKILPDGTGFTKLLDFSGFENNSPQVFGNLVFDGTYLYGLTSQAGGDLRGNIFRINTDGSGFTQLYEFLGTADGYYPMGSLLRVGTSLYGMTQNGGNSDWGVLFEYSLTPSATITITGQPSDYIACVGDIANFSTAANGTTNITYQWQYSPVPSGPYTDISNGSGYSGATTQTLSVNTTGNFGSGRYRCRINGDAAPEVMTFNEGLFINPYPLAPSTTNASSCAAASLNLTASGGINGQYRWYTLVTGGTPIPGEVNDTYVTPVLSTTTSYFVSVNNGSCESARAIVTASINIVPKPVLVTSNCTATAATLTGPPGFTTYNWSNGANTQQTNITTAGSYTLVVTDANGCSSPASDPTVFTATFCNQPPVISTTSVATVIAGSVSISLTSLLSDPDNNLDLTTLKVFTQPTSGAIATIGPNETLLLDYKNTTFAGKDQVTIEVCDFSGACAQQVITIDVAGDLVVYSGISPDGNGQNDTWIIQFIDLLPDTKDNHVSLFNRWGDVVFETDNYDNVNRVFTGLNKNGNVLATGTYFYKIEFASGLKTRTGYLSLKR